MDNVRYVILLMREASRWPAQQLGSISARYRARGARSGQHRLPPSVTPVASEAEPDHAPSGAAGDPLARPVPIARLEAVLLVAREPLPTRKLAHLAGLADGTEARTLIRRLNKLYDQSQCAFRVEQVAGGYQLFTREQFAPWLGRLHEMSTATRLSGPALETLAAVVYRQPVLRADVESIRGVQCGEILRQLMDRDLVRIVGRSEELGRPYLYGSTRRFLQLYGLRSLDDLPRVGQTRAALAPTHRDDVATSLSPPSGSAGAGEKSPEEDQEVTITCETELEEIRGIVPSAAGTLAEIVAYDEEEDDIELDEEDDEDDDFEEDEEDDEELEDEDDEEFDDEDDGFEDADWEEVDDEEEDDEEEDWEDDDDDEDWDDDDEEEDDDWDEEDEL